MTLPIHPPYCILYSDLQLQDLDADTSSSKTLDRKKRDVHSEQVPAPEESKAADQIAQSKSDSQSEGESGAIPSLYNLDDASSSQYGTVQRSARQLRGQTSNQPWPSDYEVVDTPYSSSNNYYNTNKGVAYHNRPSQNVPYIQYAEKSPRASAKAKKSQNSDILPLLLTGFNLQKQTYHQQQQQVKQQHHQQQQQAQSQQYLDDEENTLPDNFSYFHLGKGQSNFNSDKKQSQLKYNYVPNTTPKGSNSYIAFSTVGGFYNNQPVTQSPSNKYLKQQYFTPSDGRWLSNTNGQGAASGNSNKQHHQNTNSNLQHGQEETFYTTYQNFPNNDRPVEIGGSKPKHTHHQQHYQQTPEKVTPSYTNEEEFYPTHGYNKNLVKQPSVFNTNFQSPYVEEVVIKPKRPHFESSSPKGQSGFFVTEKPRNVHVVNGNKEKPVYESNDSEAFRKPNTNAFSATYSGFDEFLAGIRNTNFQDIKPTYMKNLTVSHNKPHSTSTQKPKDEYYNDEEYYYDDEYEDPPVHQQPAQRPLLPQKPVKQHSSYGNDNNNNNQYFYNTGNSNYQNQNSPIQESLNNHFKIPIQQHGHIMTHTTSKPTTVARPKPLTTSTVKYPTTTPSYAPAGSDEYYYDDEDYDYKIPQNASKYMPMSETMAPRPTQPSNGQRPHSPYNKYNIHTSNYHFSAPMDNPNQPQGGSGKPPKYDVATLDDVDDNNAGNEDEYQIDIRILNNTGTRNQIPNSNAVPSILQFPDDYFQGINLRPNNSKVKTQELYTKPNHNHQPTNRPAAAMPTSTMATKIVAATVKYTKPYTASSTPAIVTIKQRPTTTAPTTTVTTTELPPVPTTRRVYTVRPSRVSGQKWKPAKKNKNKTEQLELDERFPNR